MQAQFILRTIALLILTNTTLQNQVAETHTNRKRYQDVPVNPDASDMRPLYPWGTGKPSDICVDGSHPACCAPFLPGTIHLNCGAVFDSDNDKSIAEKCTDFGRYLFFCCRNFFKDPHRRWGIECSIPPGNPEDSGRAQLDSKKAPMIKPGRKPPLQQPQQGRICLPKKGYKDSSDITAVGCTSDNSDDDINAVQAANIESFDELLA